MQSQPQAASPLFHPGPVEKASERRLRPGDSSDAVRRWNVPSTQPDARAACGYERTLVVPVLPRTRPCSEFSTAGQGGRGRCGPGSRGAVLAVLEKQDVLLRLLSELPLDSLTLIAAVCKV